MKIVQTLLLALALAAPSAFARTSVPIINHDNISVSHASGQPATAEQIKRAIDSAAAARGWQVSHQGPGKAVVILHVKNKHTMSVDITYSAGRYSAVYRDSVNLNYEPGEGSGKIHPNYNKWLQMLLDTIRIELGRG